MTSKKFEDTPLDINNPAMFVNTLHRLNADRDAGKNTSKDRSSYMDRRQRNVDMHGRDHHVYGYDVATGYSKSDATDLHSGTLLITANQSADQSKAGLVDDDSILENKY